MSVKSQVDRINREACAWVAKLHDTQPSRQDLVALRQWTKQSPEHVAELRRVARLWDELNVLTELAVPVEVPRLRKLGKKHLFVKPFARWAVAGAVATVAALAVFGVLRQPPTNVQQAVPSSQTYATKIGEQRLVALPDGSTVLLNTASQLRVDYSSEFRNVSLIKGEAHFDVSSDPDRAFRVIAGNGMVRAVGTAFSVHLKEKVVEVTVTEGRVQINKIESSPAGGEKPVETIENLAVVKAGQSAVFDQVVESIESIETIDRTEISRKLAWQEGLLRFSGAPLDDVVDEVSRYTPISIVIVDPELRDLPIGGFFEVGETEKMFEALESGFGVRVERINNNVVHLSTEARTTAEP